MKELRICQAMIETVTAQGYRTTMELLPPKVPQHEVEITRSSEVNELFKQGIGRSDIENLDKHDKRLDDLDSELVAQLLDVYKQELRFKTYNKKAKEFLDFIGNLGLRNVLIIYGDDETMTNLVKKLSKETYHEDSKI